jgi:hypothetical protein
MHQQRPPNHSNNQLTLFLSSSSISSLNCSSFSHFFRAAISAAALSISAPPSPAHAQSYSSCVPSVPPTHTPRIAPTPKLALAHIEAIPPSTTANTNGRLHLAAAARSVPTLPFRRSKYPGTDRFARGSPSRMHRLRVLRWRLSRSSFSFSCAAQRARSSCASVRNSELCMCPPPPLVLSVLSRGSPSPESEESADCGPLAPCESRSCVGRAAASLVAAAVSGRRASGCPGSHPSSTLGMTSNSSSSSSCRLTRGRQRQVAVLAGDAPPALRMGGGENLELGWPFLDCDWWYRGSRA